MKINKKLIALSIASSLVLPMVGCNASIKVDDKEIFSYGKDKTQVEEFNKFDKKMSEEEAIDAIINGNYKVTYNGEQLKVPMIDVLNTLFPNCEISTMFKDENTLLVKFESGDNYIIYRLSFLTDTLVEQELYYNGVTFTEANDEAHNAILQLIAKEVIEKNNVIDDNKPTEEKKETDNKSKEEKKETTDFDDRELQKNLCTCKYCGKKYDPQESNCWENETFCSKQCQLDYEEQQAAKEEESYKYYCAWCGNGFRPDASTAEDNYSFCSEACEGAWYEDQQQVIDDYNNGIDHSACKNCGKEIGLNGYQGYCYSCAEDLGIGR